MWYSAEGTTRPENIDTTSSKKWNYVRKDIHTEERTDEMTGEAYTVYVWLEMKIAKENWELYLTAVSNEARLADVEEAITELYGI